MLYSFTLLLSLLTLSFSQNCPTASWVQCAKRVSEEQEDVLCTVRNMNQTTIAYGNPTTNQWSFTDISFYGNGAASLSCSDDSFGTPVNQYPLYCCYYPTGSMLSDHLHGAKSISSNWVYIGYQGQLYIDLTTISTLPIWIRYGSTSIGRYTYRIMQGTVSCTDDVLGDLDNSGTLTGKPCYAFQYSPAFNDFASCGTDDGGSCDFSANAALVPPIMRVGRMGTPSTSLFWYRYLYSNTGSMMCDSDLYENPDPSNLNQQCDILYASQSNFFSYNLGYWYLAKQCIGCNSINSMLPQGVDSTSDYATTTDWINSYQSEMSTTMRFANTQTNSQEDLSYSTANNIATTMATDLTMTMGNTCSSSCTGSGSVSGNLYVYQWIVTSYEQVDLEITKFNAYSCNYICKTSSNPPVCPLGYCADDACTTCDTY